MEVDKQSDPKKMSLDDIIKKNGGNKKAAGGRGGRAGNKPQAGGVRGKEQRQRKRNFNDFAGKGGDKNNNNKAQRTGNMISKRRDDRPRASNQSRPIRRDNVQGRSRRRTSDDRTFGKSNANDRPRASPLPRRGQTQVAPKGRQRTLKIGAAASTAAPKQFVKQKVLKPSDVRLKVRNLDEKQVTNDDLKKLFQKIGDLRVCRFDRNEFGQFLGSATVTFERSEDARRAVSEYNGAYLDDKVLTVEFDMVSAVTQVVKGHGGQGNVQTGQQPNGQKTIFSRTQSRGGQANANNKGMGKTLKINN